MPPNNYLFSNQFDRQIEVMPKIIHQYHVYFLASKKKNENQPSGIFTSAHSAIKGSDKMTKNKAKCQFRG